MPKRCVSFGCFGNYKGQPYVRIVKFPTDVNVRERWIQPLPNSRGSLDQRKEIYIFVLVTLTAVELLREVVTGQLIHLQFSHKYRSNA